MNLPRTLNIFEKVLAWAFIISFIIFIFVNAFTYNTKVTVTIAYIFFGLTLSLCISDIIGNSLTLSNDNFFKIFFWSYSITHGTFSNLMWISQLTPFEKRPEMLIQNITLAIITSIVTTFIFKKIYTPKSPL